jgi:hypothetical protein
MCDRRVRALQDAAAVVVDRINDARIDNALVKVPNV